MGEDNCETPDRMLLWVIIFVVYVFVVGDTGNMRNYENYQKSYRGIRSHRVRLAPPGYVFGIVWPILYLMIAASGILTLYYHCDFTNTSAFHGTVALFFSNIIFNKLWTMFFFQSRLKAVAMVDACLIWLTAIIYMVLHFWYGVPLAAYLFIPYVIWVGFAILLNGEIIKNFEH